MRYTYTTNGVCSRSISFEIADNIVSDVVFTGGCNGNLKAIAKLIDGMEVDKVIRLLEGNTCGNKNTSCTDQLTKGLKEALEKELK